MENNEKQVNEEEVVLTEEDAEKVEKAIKQAHIDQTKLSPEAQKAFQQMMEQAKLPIRFEDKDFKMGEQELDVRHLNRANWRQVGFRMDSTQLAYTKAISQTLTDILRMLMVIADKMGVEDIVAATDDIIDKIDLQEKIKQRKSKTADSADKNNN